MRSALCLPAITRSSCLPGPIRRTGSLDFSKAHLGNLTLKSKDAADPAVITSTDDKHVFRLAGETGIQSLTFNGVSLVHQKRPIWPASTSRGVKLAFDHCSLSANTAILETTERASDVQIDFLGCKIKSEAQGVIVKSAKAVSFKKCALAWNNGAFVQGPAGSIIFDACSVDGPVALSSSPSPATLATSVSPRARPNGATSASICLQVSNCEGACGVLLWEHGGIRQLVITGNKIQWKYTGRVIGAGPEISWSQKAPLVDPAPSRRSSSRTNKFQFPDERAMPSSLAKARTTRRSSTMS